MRAGGLGGRPGKKAESKRKHFSVSLAGSPTKPLTRAVSPLRGGTHRDIYEIQFNAIILPRKFVLASTMR